jgi:hypothetical protein
VDRGLADEAQAPRELRLRPQLVVVREAREHAVDRRPDPRRPRADDEVAAGVEGGEVAAVGGQVLLQVDAAHREVRHPGAAAISAAASRPRADSIAQMIGLPGARSATRATSSGDSVLGIRMPWASAATASRSAAHRSVRAALTRTQARGAGAQAAGGSASAAATIRRAAAFCAGGTASSR